MEAIKKVLSRLVPGSSGRSNLGGLMVEIISKRDGPHREEANLRRLLGDNRATITRLADHLSQGAYSASKAPRAAPKPQGLIIRDLGPARSAAEPRPTVRISPNASSATAWLFLPGQFAT